MQELFYILLGFILKQNDKQTFLNVAINNVMFAY